MHAILFGLLILLLNVVDVSAHSYFTNEPAGSRFIAECPLDPTVCNAVQGFVQIGRWYNLYQNGTFYSDAAEPASPSTAFKSVLPYTGPCVGTPPLPCAIGGSQIGHIDSQANREYFVGLTFKVNATYTCSSVGKSKTFFMRSIDNTLGFQQTNGVFLIEGCGATKSWIFSHNSAENDNSHTCALDLGLACYPNVGSGAFAVDTWVKLEACIRSSSSVSARDGALVAWLNGAPMMRYTDFNYGSGNINQWDQNETWDGYYNGQGFTTTAEQHFGHVYISAPPDGGCTGVPIVSDNIAPSQVGGVAVSNITSSSLLLSWNPATDNVGIAGYNVEMCTGLACTTYAAKQSTTGTGTSVTITGLSPATSNSFRLKARDAAGNVSAQYSTPISATTAVPSATLTRNTLATDNFNRADNSDLGAAWSPGYATGTGTIVSNAVRSSLADSDEFDEVYNAVSPGQDQWAQATLSTWPANATLRYGWLMVRAAGPPTVTWYQCTVARNGGGFSVAIEKKVAGVQTVLTSNNTTIWSAGDVVLCEATGTNPTTINLYRNGTLVLTATDTTSPLSGGQAGLGAYMVSPTTTLGFDDFSVGDFVGLTAPKITGVVTDSAGADITWASGPTSLRINYDAGQMIVPIASVPGGRLSFVWPIDTTFACIFAIDSQGNVNTTTSDYVCAPVVPSSVDTIPPAVSSPLPSGTLAAGTTSVTLSVVTSEPATCKYAATPGVAYNSMTGVFSTPISNTQHSVVVTGLSNGTAYTFYVKCSDITNNITPADTTISFSVNASATDIVAPTVPTSVSGVALNANQIQLSFTPSTDAVGVAGYQVYACITASCITFNLVANGGGSPIIVNGLQPNTKYSLKLRAFDAVQNLSGFSSVIDITTPILDTVPPSKMLNLVATRTGYDSFDISWDPGTDDNQVSGAAIEICVGDGCNVFKLQYIVTGRTSITINGLASQLPYYFRGKHIDTAGNVSGEYSDLAKGEPFPLQSGTVQGVCACQIP